ncbi:hypothetical protein SPBR_03023 [Sporothrix brasiliensis 5110]|uniref:Uncharacterized protein n=1 Tax=Sporothrix brasiliensis 5110 TaxID=1398154 RepID=A0A0C2J7I6_9PEZI|nr:uncharacterized protein SPBR_03023 [Sporothrix brasiliensis 5110]KIH92992.1 hypothetical protein SPBR_03023 [Sporothrix brasiliensis 5110]
MTVAQQNQQQIEQLQPPLSAWSPPPEPPLQQRQDLFAPTSTAVSTSVSVSVSVYTSTSTETSTSTAVATSTTTATDSTRVLPLFYLDERAFEGLPYTVLHRVCGSVAGVDADGGATTFVITTTRIDLVATATAMNSTGEAATALEAASSTDTNLSTTTMTTTTRRSHISPTASIITASSSWANNATGPPSTITQGPSTFVFTGTRFGDPSRTLVNQCRLSGTSSARCNLTHVGPIWYTADANWNGTYSTYNYTWTSGDRYGFAPCTVTAGVSLLGPPTAVVAAPSSTNGAARAGAPWRGEREKTVAPRAMASLVSFLLSPELRNVVWPLFAMLGCLVGLFALA